MADEEDLDLEELEEPDLEAVELEDIDDGEMADDDVDVAVDEVVLGDDVLDDADVVEPVEVVVAEEDDDDEEDDVDPDEVEAGLDVILKDRLVVEEEEEEEEEEGPPDPEDRAEGSTKVVPKRPEEFVCQSCFLVKHPSQLADSSRMLCRDCV
jgi:hypothetical protein